MKHEASWQKTCYIPTMALCRLLLLGSEMLVAQLPLKLVTLASIWKGPSLEVQLRTTP